MRTLLSKLIGSLALATVCASASAQVLPNPLPLPFPSFKWDQRYTPPRATFSSKITTCTQPQPAPVIALDDWLCTKPGPILRVGWWGWLRTPAQGQRPFYIAIYRQDPTNTCRPLNPPIYRTCVVPDQVVHVSKSCQTIPGTNVSQPIYYLSAKLNPPFIQDGTQTNPQHYFLQISEIDSDSLQFGVEDFRWAGRRPLQVCPAMQFSSAGGFIQPLLDACDQKEDDLSFRLFSRAITGTLNPAVATPKGHLTIRLFNPANTAPGQELEVCSWSFGVSNPGSGGGGGGGAGKFSLDFDSPDGTYVMQVDAPGCLPMRKTVQLQEGTEFEVDSFFDVFYGDLDGDGFINTFDLTQMLGNFGRSS